jgi:hypothetical protein
VDNKPAEMLVFLYAKKRLLKFNFSSSKSPLYLLFLDAAFVNLSGLVKRLSKKTGISVFSFVTTVLILSLFSGMLPGL